MACTCIQNKLGTQNLPPNLNALFDSQAFWISKGCKESFDRQLCSLV